MRTDSVSWHLAERFDENVLLFSNTFVFPGSKKKPCFFSHDVAQCPAL
jgi:hypothetical protein